MKDAFATTLSAHIRFAFPLAIHVLLYLAICLALILLVGGKPSSGTLDHTFLPLSFFCYGTFRLQGKLTASRSSVAVGAP